MQFEELNYRADVLADVLVLHCERRGHFTCSIHAAEGISWESRLQVWCSLYPDVPV
jgi:hypothetical protein